MGRVLTTERRQAAIAWWRARFIAATRVTRPTSPALISLLKLNAADFSDIDRDRLAEARRNLWTALALPLDARPTALNAWLAKYLVDTGPHLLLNKAQRNSVLASIRNDDRRERDRLATVRQVTLRVPADVAQRLRKHARDGKLPNNGAAINALFEGNQPKPRASPKKAIARLDEPDLFGGAVPEGNTAAPPDTVTKPQTQKKK